MEIRNVEERPTLAVRLTTSVDKLPQVMEESFGEIFRYLSENDANPAGPPYALYHNTDMNNLDVEMGFPVDPGMRGEGSIVESVLPGGRAAVGIHLGPYESIESTYNKLVAFVAEQGLEMESFMYELYLNDPDEVPPEQIETEIYIPLKA